MEAKDVENEVCFETINISISDFESVFFTVEIASTAGLGLEDDDYVDVKYVVDGGQAVTIEDWENDGGIHTLENDFPLQTIRVQGIQGDSLKIMICLKNDGEFLGTSESFLIDNLKVKGITENPDLESECPLKVVLVLDESGSIADASGAEQDIEAGASAYVNSVLNSGISGYEIAVVEFNTNARPIKLDADGGFANMDAAYATAFANYLNDGVGDLDG